jgi:hypothetical protein
VSLVWLPKYVAQSGLSGDKRFKATGGGGLGLEHCVKPNTDAEILIASKIPMILLIINFENFISISPSQNYLAICKNK